MRGAAALWGAGERDRAGLAALTARHGTADRKEGGLPPSPSFLWFLPFCGPFLSVVPSFLPVVPSSLSFLPVAPSYLWSLPTCGPFLPFVPSLLPCFLPYRRCSYIALYWTGRTTCTARSRLGSFLPLCASFPSVVVASLPVYLHLCLLPISG